MSFPPNPSDPLPPPQYSSSAYPTDGYPLGNPNQLPMLLAVGSLVTGLLGTITCGCCLFIPAPLLSIVLGTAVLFNRPDNNAKVMAIIGIVTSTLTLIVFVGSHVFLMINAAASR
jgi:hypothetical protein